jgi:hypothetical protein
VFFRDPSNAKQAGATLVLAVSWTFVGTEGGVTQPSADVVDPATGSVLEHGFSSIIGPSGLAGTFSGPVALPFSTIYKKKDAPLRVYFKTGAGDLQLWWSREAQPVVVDQAKLIQLSPAWLAAAKELPPTPDHPAGGLSLSSHTPNGQPLVFFLEFTETQTLVPSPQIKGMGTE